MTLVIERLIFCDGCGENQSGDDRNGYTAKEMRKSRQAEGWIQRGNKDYCPRCKHNKPSKATPATQL